MMMKWTHANELCNAPFHKSDDMRISTAIFDACRVGRLVAARKQYPSSKINA